MGDIKRMMFDSTARKIGAALVIFMLIIIAAWDLDLDWYLVFFVAAMSALVAFEAGPRILGWLSL